MGGVGYKGLNDFFAENDTVYSVGAVRQASGKISVTVIYPSGGSFDFSFEPLDENV